MEIWFARVAEPVYAADLKSVAVRLVGSNPTPGTYDLYPKKWTQKVHFFVCLIEYN